VTVAKKVVETTGITLNKSSLTLDEGREYQLKANVQPADATDKTVTWSTSNAEVATVSDGKVTALAEGEAVITAETYNGHKASCRVKVIIPADDITLDQTSLEMTRWQEVTLVATVTPDNATDKDVTWSSSNTRVATVDSYGTVTAVGGGTAIITATTHNGITASCSVTVYVPVENVWLDKSSYTLLVGESFTLTATIYPGDASERSVTWQNGSPAYASIETNGTSCTVTGLAAGVTVITVQAADNQTAQCTVTVLAEDPDNTEGYGTGNGQWEN
jgi:uncharacterized protein YjdB